MTAKASDYREELARLAAALAAVGNIADEAATPAQMEAITKAVADAGKDAGKALSAAMASRIDLGAFDIKFKTIVSASIGVRTATLAVPDAKVGDRVYAHATAPWAAGYAVVGNGYVSANGQVELRVLTPVIGLVVDVTLPVRLIGFRATA